MNPESFTSLKEEFPSAELFRIPILFEEAHPAQLGALMGRVNAETFEGRAPTTVWFAGPEGSSSKRIGHLVFVYRSEGWNTLFRPETQRWEEVRHRETNEPLYQSADFTLFAPMRVPEPKPWLTGERRVSGPLRPGLNVEVHLGHYPRKKGLSRTLLVVVRNVGTVAVRDLVVDWVFENEAHQPEQIGSVQGMALGGSLGLAAEDSFHGTLEAGHVAPFVLDPCFLEAAVSQAAALSSERYWLSVRSGDEEIRRVTEPVVGAHLDTLTGG